MFVLIYVYAYSIIVTEEENKNSSPEEKKESATVISSTEQPNIVTPATNNKYHSDEEADNVSNSSFVVLKSNDAADPSDLVAKLKLELENERATTHALQKQKQGIDILSPI